ncbi:DNA polymerase theta isoform X2 [Rhagoletis pomonella]|uniref:DNA polymerase theta isoform X2 n=1 Tax=Rhagoletis pomonella TaxID=28610 RepID=UPI00177CC2B9|nr:DNA polymerase theta isoform X2 [Rhagoletis pomonella]
MAFSQSLDIGNSTLLNLDSQARHAIDQGLVGKGQNGGQDSTKNGEDAAEVIEESPTREQSSKQYGNVAGMSMFSRSRTQRLRRGSNSNTSNALNSEVKDRRRLRKSKSDSTLPKSEYSNAKAKNENYTELFRSGFTFSIEEHPKSSRLEEGSVLRVSQIEAAFVGIEEENLDTSQNEEKCSFRDADSLVTDLEIPIFSEDFKNLIEPIDEDKNESVQTSPPELPSDGSNDISKNNEMTSEPEIHQLDNSRFVYLDLHNSEANQQLAKELEQSRRELAKVKETVETAPLKNEKANSYVQNSIQSKATGFLNQPSQIKIKKVATDLESLKRISAWNLPRSVLQEYEKKGVVKMFDWQIECLSNPKVLFEHCNLVYSAPTSAGKSLVSEILLLKTVLERGKKVLFILPFISVVREKMTYLQDLLTVAGYRVEGFFGGYTPPGGFDNIHVAICTIEKANSIINKLLEHGKLADIGTIVVDEVHLISDPGRGYILELLIAKVLYMCRKYGLKMQVIAMSATLANVELLKRWLDAELFITDFRPVALQEMIKIGNKIYDCKMRPLRDISERLQGEKYPFPPLQNDNDHVAQLCIETLLEGCSVIVFCPSKDWCENLATQLASAIQALIINDDNWGKRLRLQIKNEAIEEVKKQLRDIPTGLDDVLDKTITCGCAFHHAGLTSEERDIIEASFKSCGLKIIVATSTLSSGVNLPARRVLIRTPLFGGRQMSSLTYRQMIGRAGRTGKDTLGESILICTPANARIGQALVQEDLKPIFSCLEQESSTHLKRALLEVISSGVATTKDDIANFVKCTLLSAEKQLSEQGKDNSEDGDNLFITDAVKFLVEYEFVRLQVDSETNRESYVATRLGQACLSASMPPTDGLLLFAELQKSRRCFVLESELHAVYLVTPYSVCYQLQDLDWLLFLDMWEKLSPAMKKVGELVGVKESFLVRAMRGQTKLDYKLMQIHKRFYTALALQELVNEVPINAVAAKYKCTRGMLQSLQQMSSTFAGIVTAFCNTLQWSTLSLVVSQFKERLFFGIHRDLIDLMRLPDLNHKRARALFDAGITTLVELANADVFDVEKVLYNALSFDSAKQHENEADYEAEQRNQVRDFFITGKIGLTVAEGAKLLIQEARIYVQYEIGVGAIKWTQEDAHDTTSADSFHMSYEEHRIEQGRKRKSEKSNGVKKSEVTPPKQKRLSPSVKEDLLEEKPSTSKEALRVLRQQQKKAVEQNKQRLENNEKQGGDLNIAKTSINASNKENVAAKSSSITPENLKQTTVEMNGNKQKQTGRSGISPGTKTSKLNKLVTSEGRKEEKNKNTDAKVPADGGNAKIVQNFKATQVVARSRVSENNATNSVEEGKAAESMERKPIQMKVNTDTKKYSLRKSTENAKPPQIAVAQPHSVNLPYKTTPNVNGKAVGHTPKSLNEQTTTKSTYKQSPKATQVLPSAPRRSPRNHQRTFTSTNPTSVDAKFAMPQTSAAAKHFPNEKYNLDESLFMADDSFELNTGIKAALEVGNELKNSSASPKAAKSNVDEIPESQQIVQAVADSPAPAKHSVHASRLLRTTQRLKAQKSSITKKELTASSPPSSSIEVSELSLENSLLKNPLQLNASHILNCSKVDTASANFNRLEVVDISGDQKLFQAACRELIEVKRFGFCVGLQQQENKRKPLIGGNLLINQMTDGDAAEKDVAAKDFQIDDNTYLAGCAFGVTENIVYYINMQTAGTCKSVTAEMKIKCLKALLAESGRTLICIDAKEQMKILCRILGELGELRVDLEDPKVANWLLQPDKFMSFQQITQQFAPECTALTSLCGNGRGYGSHGLDTASAILAKMFSRGLRYSAYTESTNRESGAHRLRTTVQIF